MTRGIPLCWLAFAQDHPPLTCLNAAASVSWMSLSSSSSCLDDRTQDRRCPPHRCRRCRRRCALQPRVVERSIAARPCAIAYARLSAGGGLQIHTDVCVCVCVCVYDLWALSSDVLALPGTTKDDPGRTWAQMCCLLLEQCCECARRGIRDAKHRGCIYIYTKVYISRLRRLETQKATCLSFSKRNSVQNTEPELRIQC